MLKFLPTSLYNIPAVETWLADQARRGWHAVGFLGELVRFQKGEPRKTAYRLEPQFLRDAAPDPEVRALYADAGWEYLASAVQNGFFLWRSTRPDPREVHTDPEAEDLTYAWLAERQKEQLRTTCAGAFVTAALLLLFMCLDRTMLLTLIGAMHPINLLLFTGAAVKTARDFAEFLTIRRLRRQLLSGVPPAHTAAPYRLRRWVRRGMAAAVAAVFLGTLFLAYKSGAYGELDDVPVPAAARLGVEAPMEPPFGMRMEGIFLKEWSATQACCDAFGRKTAGWRTEVYELRVPLLAGQVLREVVYSEITDELGEASARLQDTPFDEARYLRDGGTQYLAARLGGRVLYYEADVPEDLRDHLDAFAAALAARGEEGPSC